MNKTIKLTDRIIKMNNRPLILTLIFSILSFREDKAKGNKNN